MARSSSSVNLLTLQLNRNVSPAQEKTGRASLHFSIRTQGQVGGENVSKLISDKYF